MPRVLRMLSDLSVAQGRATRGGSVQGAQLRRPLRGVLLRPLRANPPSITQLGLIYRG